MGTYHKGSLPQKLANLAVGESLLLDATEAGVPTTQMRVVSAVTKMRKRQETAFFSVTQQAFYGVSPGTREVIVVNKVTRIAQ